MRFKCIVYCPYSPRRKAGAHPEVMDIHQQQQENSLACIQLPRDVSTELRPAPDPASDTNHLQPSASSGPVQSAAPNRPKSPLEYLSSLPKQGLVSAFSRAASGGAGGGDVSKSTSNSVSRFSLPKPNLKMNFQNMDVVRRIKDVGLIPRSVRSTRSVGGVWGVHTDDAGDQYDSGIDVPDGETSGRESEPHTEVVMDGCGILASSPKQVLLSSIQLQAESKRHGSLSDSPLIQSPLINTGEEKSRPAESSEAENSFTFPEELPLDSDGNKSQEDGNTSAKFEKPVDPQESSTMQADKETIPDKHGKEAAKEDGIKEEAEDDLCMIGTEDVQEILSRCHQLHHPLMKTSHSETSLTAMAGHALGGSVVDGASAPDPSLMSRLKLKMTSLSRPLTGTRGGGTGFNSYVTASGSNGGSSSSGPSEAPVHTKTHIRKSQRAMDVFEQLLREKLPTMECKSRYIFI